MRFFFCILDLLFVAFKLLVIIGTRLLHRLEERELALAALKYMRACYSLGISRYS